MTDPDPIPTAKGTSGGATEGTAQEAAAGTAGAAYRAGFACLVGRPNAGKSTLTNALVGHKVAITSAKPQTTRHAVRGISTTAESQLVLVDTPGLHRPRTLLGERLNDLVRETLLGVDVVGFCLPADQRVGPGDQFIAAELAELQRARRTPVVAIVTKTDLVPRDRLVAQLVAVDALGDWTAVVPCSATSGSQVDDVRAVLAGLLPLSPPLYPEQTHTDEPDEVMVAELVREAALDGVRDELPHSLAVVVEEIVPREGRREGAAPMLDVRVSIYVERDSQKAIVIGKGGARLRAVGAAARTGIEALLGVKVFLDLHVKVAKDWQRDPKALTRLGF